MENPEHSTNGFVGGGRTITRRKPCGGYCIPQATIGKLSLVVSRAPPDWLAFWPLSIIRLRSSAWTVDPRVLLIGTESDTDPESFAGNCLSAGAGNNGATIG